MFRRDLEPLAPTFHWRDRKLRVFPHSVATPGGSVGLNENLRCRYIGVAHLLYFRRPGNHQLANGLVKELREVEPATLPERDVRAGKPVLSGVLRYDLLRAVVRIVSLATLDLIGLILAIYTALVVKTAIVNPDQLGQMWAQAKDYLPLGGLVMLLLFARSGLYRERAQRPGFSKVIAGLFQVTLVVLIYAEIEGERFQSYYIFYASLFFALLYVSSLRWVFERISGAVLRAAGYRRRAVLVGSGSNIQAVSHALSDSREIEPYGFVARTPIALLYGLRDFRSLEQLERHFDSVDEVLIADADFPQEEAVELVERCHRHGVRVRVAPSTMEILMDSVEYVPGQALPLFELKPPVFEGADWVVKRTFDLLGAALLMIVLAPVMGVAALAIKLSSRGPVLYRSIRPGIGGKPFACFKFRTMVVGAEHLQDHLEPHNEVSGAIFKMKDDPRITSVGRFLRRWSLDELPQLLNVLRGEMSLVGPRPLPARDYHRLEDWHRKRYLVLPGMTGLWQVSGRSELDFDELVRLDFLYLERWSVFLDLTILLKTIPAVIRARGAW
jgi:exopolysaccharide biosynthesis polyprenyl glycosylphosphotransferase